MDYTKEEKSPDIPQRNRYIFCDMEVGDSLFFSDPKVGESARVAASQFVRRKSPNWRFSLRKMNDGWRLFRVQ